MLANTCYWKLAWHFQTTTFENKNERNKIFKEICIKETGQIYRYTYVRDVKHENIIICTDVYTFVLSSIFTI